jgi:hypothetical protein
MKTLKSSWMLRRIDWYIVSDVSIESSVSIYLTVMMQALHSSKTSVNIYQSATHDITREHYLYGSPDFQGKAQVTRVSIQGAVAHFGLKSVK